MNRLIIFVVFFIFSAAAAADCNVKNHEKFDGFFSKWSKNKKFSLTRTLFPIKSIEYSNNGTEAESVPVYGQISKAEVESNPSLSEYILKQSLAYDISSVSSESATVKVFKADTDWLYEYHFKKLQGCWYLHEVEDLSTFD
ncbi:MAG TPA: hypothetical protein VK967_04805 [Methylotenera sp.]|nr:hypothetical protein [Methylotenera sp.]